MIIDRKFKFVATNPCKGNVYTEEDAFVICAKDRAVPAMLRAYVTECERIGCAPEHIESVLLLHERVVRFQELFECRVPDTETQCEIDRYIGGNV